MSAAVLEFPSGRRRAPLRLVEDTSAAIVRGRTILGGLDRLRRTKRAFWQRLEADRLSHALGALFDLAALAREFRDEAVVCQLICEAATEACDAMARAIARRAPPSAPPTFDNPDDPA